MYAAPLICSMLLGALVISCYALPLESLIFADLKDIYLSHDEGRKQYSIECEYLDLKDVKFLEEGFIFITAYNAEMAPTQSYILVDNERICFNRSERLKKEILNHCPMWKYNNDEFEILENGSILLDSIVPVILETGTYEIVEDELYTCFVDEDYPENSTSIDDNHIKAPEVSVMLGKVGCSISIAALIVHLIIFCIVPTLRNLPGYNLASLSIAFLIAYTSLIVGQIPDVLGLACVLSGIVQLNCFLVVFFCTNVMAFDVWRSLRMATLKLAVSSENKKKIQFIIYTLYAWGVPLIITVTVVILDNLDGVPSWIKPGIGDNMVCWVTNKSVKMIFFSVPAFAIFMLNGVFFILSAVIIKNNTMKNISEHHNQTVRLNFILYVRLGLMMGVTWLFSVLATLFNNDILWLIFDFLNSLQGLFIFVMFTCSRKVFQYVKQRINLEILKTSTTGKKSSSLSDKQTTNTSTVMNRETMFLSSWPVSSEHASNSSTVKTTEMAFTPNRPVAGENKINSSTVITKETMVSPLGTIDGENTIKSSTAITKEIMVSPLATVDVENMTNSSTAAAEDTSSPSGQ